MHEVLDWNSKEDIPHNLCLPFLLHRLDCWVLLSVWISMTDPISGQCELWNAVVLACLSLYSDRKRPIRRVYKYMDMDLVKSYKYMARWVYITFCSFYFLFNSFNCFMWFQLEKSRSIFAVARPCYCYQWILLAIHPGTIYLKGKSIMVGAWAG